jgi:hypothetical protein
MAAGRHLRAPVRGLHAARDPGPARRLSLPHPRLPDNGFEFINHKVAAMLDKLRVEFTKSRPRHSNDNALAESKNGAVVRKHLGYGHIPQRFAAQVNAFCAQHLNPYVNFHRPCFFAVETIDDKGRRRRLYPKDQIMTPCEKLLSMPTKTTPLKHGLTRRSLRHLVSQMSDNQAAQQLNAARTLLFQSIFRRSKNAA